jgi:hypothetical protein
MKNKLSFTFHSYCIKGYGAYMEQQSDLIYITFLSTINLKYFSIYYLRLQLKINKLVKTFNELRKLLRYYI